MKFLVDAHLPPSVAKLLNDAGHDAIHCSDLPAGNATSDEGLNEISVAEERVVISKDIDFYNSLVLHSRPWKLVLVRTGNIGTRDLTAIFSSRLDAIVDALEKNTLVEIDRESMHAAP